MLHKNTVPILLDECTLVGLWNCYTKFSLSTAFLIYLCLEIFSLLIVMLQTILPNPSAVLIWGRTFFFFFFDLWIKSIISKGYLVTFLFLAHVHEEKQNLRYMSSETEWITRRIKSVIPHIKNVHIYTVYKSAQAVRISQYMPVSTCNQQTSSVLWLVVVCCLFLCSLINVGFQRITEQLRSEGTTGDHIF